MSDDRSDDPEADPFDDDSDGDPFGDDPFGDEPSDETDDGFDEPDADEADDPFAALGEGVDDGPDPARDDARGTDDADIGWEADAAATDDGGETSSWADPDPSASGDPEPSAPADDPFAELDADASDAPTDEDPFESMGSGDVGEEDVWEALDEGTSVGADAAGSAAVGDAEAPGSEFAGTAPGAGTPGDERVVDKRSYCQQCPHFTAPPETACTHEGTEIVESVDFSRFRVRDCPMVDAEDPAFDE